MENTENLREKGYIFGPGLMTKMAVRPIYSKILKNFSTPEPLGRSPCNLVCSIWNSSTTNFFVNDNSWLTLINFTARSNLVS